MKPCTIQIGKDGDGQPTATPVPGLCQSLSVGDVVVWRADEEFTAGMPSCDRKAHEAKGNWWTFASVEASNPQYCVEVGGQTITGTLNAGTQSHKSIATQLGELHGRVITDPPHACECICPLSGIGGALLVGGAAFVGTAAAALAVSRWRNGKKAD